MEHSELAARLGAALGPNYRIERELGRGGMGLVFQARDLTLDRQVAVKVMHPDLAVHPSITQRFLAEARMIARLRHPNIVTVHAAGEATGFLYYVMDHIPGESLRQRLNRDGRLPPEEVARITGQIADALQAAGAAGLVHRDVKPENILLESATGRALLADFGIARVLEADAASPITGQGVAVGTPTYMSPEQAAGEAVDARSDLYSLGLVAYEMLAGFPPFRGPSSAAVISMQLNDRPRPLARVRPGTPAVLEAVIMRALEKAPARRWQTGQEMSAALGQNRLPRRSRRPVLLTAAVALLVLAGGLGWLRFRSGAEEGRAARRSLLILPFDNLRGDASLEWLREGSVNMLSLTMSQWNDLSVVDHERMHDLLAHAGLRADEDFGLDRARQLAREAGAGTVVLGNYTAAGDSLFLVARVFDVATGRRLDVAEVSGLQEDDVRPLFDQLAGRLLDLSGAPGGVRAGLAEMTTSSLEAYRAYLRGIDALNQWNLSDADRELRRAIGADSTFALAYYRLALTRGWMVGANDSAGVAAIREATRFSDRLPVRERTMVDAYRTFLQEDYATARGLYQALLARDPRDADAWYGLGDAWFHDTGTVKPVAHWTNSLRAFEQALRLDPGYSLAYDHILTMLTTAGRPYSPYALITPDSFVPARTESGQPFLDSTRLAQAVRRAGAEAVARGRMWVARQPETPRAHLALMEAMAVTGNYQTALQELEQVRQLSPGVHPELRFVEGRLRFQAGDVEEAADLLRTALDSVQAADFAGASPASFVDVNSAANVFAYLGDLRYARRALNLGDAVRRLVYHPGAGMDMEHYHLLAISALYANAGGPTSQLRGLWESAAEQARAAPRPRRREIAQAGTPAAVELLVGADDPSALTELQALVGEPLPRVVRALLALRQGARDSARLVMADTANAPGEKGMGLGDQRPLLGLVYLGLEDYQRTLDVLQGFEPKALSTRGFDSRWGLLGRVHLIRGRAYEKLGRRTAAADEYRAALAQWKSADPVFRLYQRQAQMGLARTTGAG